MRLQNLLQRCYAILGDDMENPRWFERSRLVDLLNRGCLEFRARVEDDWMTYDQGVTSGTEIYTFDSQHMRTQRIAFADQTLLPKGSVGSLTGVDERWQEHSSSNPAYWSSDALPHNQYRLIPTPSTTSADTWTNTSEWGDSTDMVDSSGTYSYSSEYGVVTAIPSYSATSEWGVVTTFQSSGADLVTIWATKSPDTMVQDGDAVPIKQAFANALVWYACWRIYEEETDHHNRELAGLYRDMWEDDLDSAVELAENPFPRAPMVMMGDYSRRAVLCVRPSDTISGVGNVTW